MIINIIKLLINKRIISALFILINFLYNCNVAPTITTSPEYVQTPSEDLGTIYPHIQFVYPGTLQTLDIPQPYLTDINSNAANFVVVFSDVMENDADEMSFVFALYEDITQIPIDINPALSSKTFIINPRVAFYKENTEYTLHIYKFAYVNNDNTRGLNFENLVESPAISLNPVNPDHVEYKFRTGFNSARDIIKPELISSIPSDGEINVDPNIPSFQLIFNDNMIPMISPLTVNEFTILLYNVTDDPSRTTNLQKTVAFDFTDNDFKTVNITPVDTLINGKQYNLRISPYDNIITLDYSIMDFQGNTVTERDIFFTIMP